MLPLLLQQAAAGAASEAWRECERGAGGAAGSCSARLELAAHASEPLSEPQLTQLPLHHHGHHSWLCLWRLCFLTDPRHRQGAG